MATNVAIDAANSNSVAISWTAATTGDAPENYRVLLGDSPSTLNSLGITTNTAVSLTNMNSGTTYFWQIQPRNVGGDNTTGPVWQFTTEGTASVDDQSKILFTLSPNPTTDFLNIQTDETIVNGTIYNGLGQVIKDKVDFTNNSVNVSSLATGLYLLKVETAIGSQTVQFIKE